MHMQVRHSVSEDRVVDSIGSGRSLDRTADVCDIAHEPVALLFTEGREVISVLPIGKNAPSQKAGVVVEAEDGRIELGERVP